jgi:hypothetical protein
VSCSNSNVGIDEKLNSFKEEIIQKMDASKLDEKFSDLVRLLRSS